LALEAQEVNEDGGNRESTSTIGVNTSTVIGFEKGMVTIAFAVIDRDEKLVADESHIELAFEFASSERIFSWICGVKR
jgi:hypothetical protein